MPDPHPAVDLDGEPSLADPVAELPVLPRPPATQPPPSLARRVDVLPRRQRDGSCPQRVLSSRTPDDGSGEASDGQ